MGNNSLKFVTGGGTDNKINCGMFKNILTKRF